MIDALGKQYNDKEDTKMMHEITITPVKPTGETAPTAPHEEVSKIVPTAEKVEAMTVAGTEAKPTGVAPVTAPQKKRTAKRDKAVATDRKLKIVVYAIACNEGKFAKRWMDSMKEADAVVVLDTGSTDDTVAILRGEGAQVETQTFNPWRFDTSRNASIDLAVKLHPDADLLVCTDIDEYFIEGWRKQLEDAWKAACRECRAKGLKEPTTAQYEYVWGFQNDGTDGTKFWYEKIHTPQSGARWTHPVHEILDYPNGEKVLVRVPKMRLEHHADPEKSRSQYLGLLEMSVKEAPMDDRNCHYLCREYLFHRKWDDCIETGKRHLALPTAKWRAERANSMRFIAKAYGEKHDALRQEIWLRRAVMECKEQREACLDLAELMHAQRDWAALVAICEVCLARTTKVMTYITKAEAWGSRPWDLYAVGLWRVGRVDDALAAVNMAIELNPKDERLQKNRRVMEQFVESRNKDTTPKK